MGQLPGIANMRRIHLARIAIEVFNFAPQHHTPESPANCQFGSACGDEGAL